MNIVLLNKKELVAKEAQKAMGTGFMGKMGGQFANAVSKDEDVCAEFAGELEKSLPDMMKQYGVNMTLKKCYARGPLLTFKFTLNEVDPRKMLGVDSQDMVKH